MRPFTYSEGKNYALQNVLHVARLEQARTETKPDYTLTEQKGTLNRFPQKMWLVVCACLDEASLLMFMKSSKQFTNFAAEEVHARLSLFRILYANFVSLQRLFPADTPLKHFQLFRERLSVGLIEQSSRPKQAVDSGDPEKSPVMTL